MIANFHLEHRELRAHETRGFKAQTLRSVRSVGVAAGSERMAADARRRGGLVIHSISMTTEARRAIAARLWIVRHVARRARRMLRDAV
jgi:hypothetical protein